MRWFWMMVAGLMAAQGSAQVPLFSEADLELATQLRERTLADNRGYEIVESLTTEVGQRLAGTEGDARAVAWARAKFQALNFDRVYTQPVTFPVWQRGAERAEVIAPYPQELVITTLGGSVGTDGQPLRAPVTQFADLAALEAAEEGSLKGRIAFIANRMERFKSGAGYGPAVAARSGGASIAARKGAVALLIRSIGTDSDRLPHTGTMRYADDAEKIPAAALSNPDADLLENMLRRPDEVVVSLTLEAGYTGEYTSQNVIGEFTGAEVPDEVVVIGGHLDSWDLGTGAIDDGAGVAITMAAAEAISRYVKRPRRTIRVVLWANEEQGLYGARAYQEANWDDSRSHIIGAESDFGAGRIWRFSTRVKPEALAMIDQMQQVLAPLGIERGNNKARGGPDLLPLMGAGMAVATLHQDGTDYFDYHHTANDTLDKIDPEALSQNVAAYAVFAWMAAQAPDDFGFDLGQERASSAP